MQDKLLAKEKILFVATVEFAVNAFLLNHLRELSKNFKVIVVVNSSDREFLSNQGVNAEVIPLGISRNISPLLDLLCLIRIFFICFSIRPLSVHTITPKAGLLGMIAAYLAFIPLRFHSVTGQVWANKRGLLRIILKLMDKLTMRLARVNIIDSQSQLNFLLSENILRIESAIVFGSGSVSGVDLDKFKPNKKICGIVRKKLSIPKEAFVFIYMGRLNIDKGILDLAKAFAKIHKPNVYLLFVGPDEMGMIPQIKYLAKECLSRIRFVGLTENPSNYLAASNVLCLPSYREGFGMVVIEAAAVGVPAIVSNIYGLVDAVKKNVTGLLHEPHDVDGIFAAMDLVMSDVEFLNKMSKAARIRVLREFDQRIMTRIWVDFYFDQILKC